MIRRSAFIAAAAFCLAIAALAFAAPASARQLAVGAAAGFHEPPGYTARPVYVWPNGRAWTPADTTMGRPFREPIYATPRGYRYVYVRGYYWKRLPNPYAPRVHRRVIRKAAVKPRRHRAGPCITDMGYGRHQVCGRFY